MEIIKKIYDKGTEEVKGRGNINMSGRQYMHHNEIITPSDKIKVFISSICGDNGRYDKLREQLKKRLEQTNFIRVYTFESKGASTLPAGDHYLWELRDSDVCIVIIDNKDGITSGVQREINEIKDNNIKALFYFCDEHEKQKTILEKEMRGAEFAKSKVVHKFSAIATDSAQAMIDDITYIYHNYSKGRIGKVTDIAFPSVDIIDVSNFNTINNIENINSNAYKEIGINKNVLENIEKSVDYLQTFILGRKYVSKNKIDELGKKELIIATEKTISLDEWVLSFLKVLLEGESIEQFNKDEFIEEVKKQQEETYNRVVNERWNAIVEYFRGNNSKCISMLYKALHMAESSNQASWVINDILIDIRNQELFFCEENNSYEELKAQDRIDKLNEPIQYPLIDRIKENLKNRYIEGMYKKKMQSPYAVTYGSDFESCLKDIIDIIAVAMYNGSLSHILQFYKNIRETLFYSCSKYDDRNLRKQLLKFIIYEAKVNDVNGVCNTYPEIINNLNANEAMEIMDFTEIHPIKYRKVISRLLAFDVVGLYLDDSVFEKYQKKIITDINNWICKENRIALIGTSIFKSLSTVSYRMEQDILVQICCNIFEKHIVGLYADVFKFIGKHIKLDSVSDSKGKKLVEYLVSVVNNDDERLWINRAPECLYVLRNQNKELTEELNLIIKNKMPEFYNDAYMIETTENINEDYNFFVREYNARIKKDNENQGKNGRYYMSCTCNIETIRALVLTDGFKPEIDCIDDLIITLSDTLIKSKEDINNKIDAITLLITIIHKYPEIYNRNVKIYNDILDAREEIYNHCGRGIFSNIDKMAVKIGMCLLGIAMKQDMYDEFLSSMPYIQSDIPTINKVVIMIRDYLNIDESIKFPQMIELIILQNVFQWLLLEREEIKWNATYIMLMLLRNKSNKEVINQKIATLIGNESISIKNLIQRQIEKMEGIDETTRQYVADSCKNDDCYLVRKVRMMIDKGEI